MFELSLQHLPLADPGGQRRRVPPTPQQDSIHLFSHVSTENRLRRRLAPPPPPQRVGVPPTGNLEPQLPTQVLKV